MFLGLVDISQKSIIFAILAGVTQFFQARMSLSRNTVDANDKSFKGEFMRSMNVQVKYILPVFVRVISAIKTFQVPLLYIGQPLTFSEYFMSGE